MAKWNRYDEKYEDDYAKADYHSRKIGTRIFGWSLTTVVAVFVTILLIGGLTWIWAPWKGALDQRKKTVGDGNYRIAAYDEFFNSCEAIAAKERIIDRYVTEVQTATGDQKVRLEAAIMAERNVRDELIADYNADAAKEGTRGQFRDSNLPFTIDPNGVTVCTAS